MTDTGKRTTLKTLAGLAAGTVTVFGANSSALAAGQSASTPVDTSLATDAGVTGNGLDIYFSPASDGPVQMVSIGNGGSSAATVRHVYPGVVTVGAHRYDLNAALVEAPLALAPGHRKTLRLTPMRTEDAGVEIPRGLTHSRPVTVTSAYEVIDGRRFVSTTRSVFA